VVIAGVLALSMMVAESRRRSVPALILGLPAVSLGLAASSWMLLPAYRFIRYGTSRGMPLGPNAASLGEFHLRDLGAYAHPLTTWLREGAASSLAGHWLAFHFVGTLVLGLAGIGLVAGWRKAQGAVWLILLGLAVGAGYQLPLVGPWLRRIPPLCYTRNSAMWLGLADFGLAWMGAVGLEALRERLRRWKGTRAWMSACAIVLTAGELFWVGYRVTPSAPAEAVLGMPEEERMLKVAMKDSGWGRVIHWPPAWEPGMRMGEAVSGRDRNELVRKVRAGMMPNLPAAAGCRAADGDNPLVPLGIGGLLTALRFARDVHSGRCRPLLELMGIRWLVSAGPVDGTTRTIFKGRSVISELPGSRQAVWVEPPEAARGIQASETAPGSWTVALEASAPCLLVVRESAVPGWRLLPPRERLGLASAWGAFVGVRTRTGACLVRLAYDPIEARVGLLLSCLALGAMLSMGWRTCR
jgi:hypothetical protein